MPIRRGVREVPSGRAGPPGPDHPCQAGTGPVVRTRTVTESTLLTDDGLTAPAAASRCRVHAVTATGTVLIEPPESPACRYQQRQSNRPATPPARLIDARTIRKSLSYQGSPGHPHKEWNADIAS